MSVKQVIEIDVTWNGYKNLSLSWLLKHLMESNMEVERLNIRNKK